MTHRTLLSLLLLAAPLVAQAPQAGPFDPSRNAAADLQAAQTEAGKTGRRVLVDVGGNWCSWCRKMEVFFEEQTELRQQRDRAFVLVKVNYSPENKNEAVLSKFPTIKGYPHFFILDASGKLLQSQDTGSLESKNGYDPAKVQAFIAAWKPGN
jgi:thioredoxin-related protein